MILCKELDSAVIIVALTKTITLLLCTKTNFSLYKCTEPEGLHGFSLKSAVLYY